MYTALGNTVTETSLPGFSADFTITRDNIVGFGGATWTDGANLDIFNANGGTGNDAVDFTLSFSNVVGGLVDSVISEYGNSTNNDEDATWAYTFGGGGLAVLTDPDNQMNEADGFSFASGGSVSNATSELGAANHTWFVTIPADSVTLDWDTAGNNNAFAEAMAFRINAAQLPPSVPEPSTFAFATLSLLSLGFVGWRRRRR